MSLFALFALVVTVTAVLAYFNARYVRLPQTIGVMVTALGLSLVLIALSRFGLGIDTWAAAALERIDFDDVLMKGMLSFLLFAGALHVDLDRLWGQKRLIALLATVGVVFTTFLVGGLVWGLAQLLGLELGLPLASGIPEPVSLIVIMIDSLFNGESAAMRCRVFK